MLSSFAKLSEVQAIVLEKNSRKKIPEKKFKHFLAVLRCINFVKFSE